MIEVITGNSLKDYFKSLKVIDLLIRIISRKQLQHLLRNDLTLMWWKLKTTDFEKKQLILRNSLDICAFITKLIDDIYIKKQFLYGENSCRLTNNSLYFLNSLPIFAYKIYIIHIHYIIYKKYRDC